MNEISLIRVQLATERAHAGAVANACAGALEGAAADALSPGSPLGEFRQASVDYLVRVLAWFEDRDQRLTDLLQARGVPEDSARRALEEVLARPGRSREALTKLEAAFRPAAPPSLAPPEPKSWREFAQYFDRVWSGRREALEALLASHARVGDWRAVAGIDADSILEERERYARVCARVPAGIVLAAPPAECDQ